MQINDCIEWSSKDEHGKFSYVGQVLALNVEKLGLVKMYVPSIGEMFFAPDDGKVKVIKKPAGFDQLVQNRQVYVEMAAKARGTKSPKSDSKPIKVASTATTPAPEHSVTGVAVDQALHKGDNKAAAIALYKSLMVNGEHPARGTVIDAFVKELGFPKTTASTYQYNCKTKWCK